MPIPGGGHGWGGPKGPGNPGPPGKFILGPGTGNGPKRLGGPALAGNPGPPGTGPPGIKFGIGPGPKIPGTGGAPNKDSCWGGDDVFDSGQGVPVKSFTESSFPLISSRGIFVGSVVAWISRSGSAGESGILKKWSR